jgi:hypothetical protein
VQNRRVLPGERDGCRAFARQDQIQAFALNSLIPGEPTQLMKSLMQLISLIPVSRPLAAKIASFATIGLGNTLIYFVVFTFAYKVRELPLVPSNVLSWLIAVSGSYVMNSLITFPTELGRSTARAISCSSHWVSWASSRQPRRRSCWRLLCRDCSKTRFDPGRLYGQLYHVTFCGFSSEGAGRDLTRESKSECALLPPGFVSHRKLLSDLETTQSGSKASKIRSASNLIYSGRHWEGMNCDSVRE